MTVVNREELASAVYHVGDAAGASIAVRDAFAPILGRASKKPLFVDCNA